MRLLQLQLPALQANPMNAVRYGSNYKQFTGARSVPMTTAHELQQVEASIVYGTIYITIEVEKTNQVELCAIIN